jgi:hypothetical protein
MWTVTFPTRLFNELTAFLFSTAPSENGCFLLANSYKRTKNDSVAIVAAIIKPTTASWNQDGPHMLEPSSTYINDAVVRADASDSSIIFVHTHPHPMHPARFSSIDEKSNKKLFDNLAQILPGRPLGSFVFTQNSICGVMCVRKKMEPISTITLSGHLLTKIPAVGFREKSGKTEPMFDRQLRFLGKTRHALLQGLTVTIVGVGGTGSSVAAQLARMGVKRLRLVDSDLIDASNVSRVYGSTSRDVGKSKVDVVKRHIVSISKTKTRAVKADVASDDVIGELVDSDVLFGCTDNLASRAILNDVSLQYCIPLIDVGCRIDLERDGAINQAVAKVQLVSPDDACMWCNGTLDGKLILQESFSDEEKEKLVKEGYYQDVRNQPSIISMTTMAASMGVHKLLNLLGVFGDNYASRTQIELKTGFMNEDTPEIKETCVCQKRRGSGNKRTILNTENSELREVVLH